MSPADDRILEATISVLARDGYAGATTRKIADEAGVNEVTLFRKFKNKENLVSEARKYSKERSLESLEKVFETIGSEDLEAYMAAIGRHLSSHMGDRANITSLAFMEMLKVPRDDCSRPRYAIAVVDHLTAYFEEQMKKGNMRKVNPRVAAMGFFSYIFYMSFICKFNGLPQEYLDNMPFEDYLDIFMGGIKA